MWHQPSNRKTKRRLKSANRLRRLKPLRAVYQAIASKLRKLSFGNKYFQTYREEHVPGFHGGQDQLGAAYAAPTDAIPLREARRKF